jgi:glycosyltransferase involved in cell wall biosynthesis
MNKPKVAVISYFHTESSLMLSKYLGDLADVDYYLFSTYNEDESPGFNYKNEKKRIGLVRVKDDLIYKFINKPNVNLYLIRIVKHTEKKIFLFFNFLIVMYVIFRLNMRGYDYVNIIGNKPVLSIVHRFLRCKKKIHTFHEVIDHLSKRSIKNSIFDYVIKHRTKVIVHSEKSYLDIIEHTTIRRDDVVFINFGLFETYKIYETTHRVVDENDYVLFFGLISPYKGLDILAEAIKLLEKEQFKYKYVIAGYGDIENIEQIRALDSVKIINRHIKNNEITDLIKNARVIVCPYKSASQSGILMTVFLFNKPVIATKVGAFGEVISNDHNGILINPNSPDELAFAIKKMYSDQELYNEIINNIEGFGKDTFDWRIIAKQTMAAFE